MKIARLLATGLTIATLGLGTMASAQDYRHDDRRHDQRDRRFDRHDDRRRGWHGNRRCHTEFRHHRRIQVCR